MSLGIGRIGHTGTLDPFASGLLVLCLGWVTRLAEYVAGRPKTYRGVIRLGERTDTDDRTGTVVARTDIGIGRDLDPGRVRAALDRQVGVIEQRPPAYSAKKLAGQRAHRLARAGAPPRLESRRVTIHRLDPIRIALPEIEFEIECASGTYVRAVARDVGDDLGVGGHLARLRRTRVGDLDVDRAVRVGPETTRPDLLAALEPPERAVERLPRIDVDDREADDLINGRPLDRTGPREPDVAALHDGSVIAVVRWRDGRLRPRKVFGHR